MARIEPLPDVLERTPELEALSRNVQRSFTEIIEQIPYLPEELQLAVTNVDDPSALAHLIAGALRISTAEKQELLEEVDVGKRLRRLSEILARELEVIQLGSKIQSQVQSEIDKGQREYYLREQLKAIQQELGEADEQQAEINELRERIEAASLPEHARKQADRELGRLERLPPAAAEYGVIRTYLEWLVELPWVATTEDNLDIAHAREVLDADHYDLEKVKDRILEYLAVRKLTRKPPPRRVPAAPGRSDPLLRRTPGRRQDQPGPVDREGARARVRTHLGRRRARRGRDPRPPAHLHRGDAGNDRPCPPRRGLAQPRVHDRRDRQDGRGLSRRPRERHARGARPGAERQLPRPLSGPRVRPVRGDVHNDGEQRSRRSHGRSRTGWRRSTSPATRWTRSSTSRKRYLVPRQIELERAEAVARSRSPMRPCGRSSRSTRERQGCETWSVRSAASAARSRGRSPRQGSRGRRRSPPSGRASCSAGAVISPNSGGAPRTPGSPPGSPGRRSAVRSCSSRPRRCRATAS